MQIAITRGIRNNNPFNLRKTSDPWQGLSAVQDDADFFKFDSSLYGIRAGVHTLLTYQDKEGLNTINQIIARFAPPSDNNDTAAYAADVAKRSGFAADQPLDMHSYDNLRPVVEAIIWHENGQQPYTDAQLVKSLVLAGVEPPQQNLQDSRTVRGGQLATVSTVGVAAIQGIHDSLDPARDALMQIIQYVDWAKWPLLAITLFGIAYMIWARIDDRRKGLR